MKGQVWHEDEDRLLRSLWGTTTRKEIAAQLRRTVSSIHKRGGRLRLPATVHTRYGGTPKGCSTGRTGMVAINVYFDPETFSEVVSLSKQEHQSFSKTALQLIEWGLMDRGAD